MKIIKTKYEEVSSVNFHATTFNLDFGNKRFETSNETIRKNVIKRISTELGMSVSISSNNLTTIMKLTVFLLDEKSAETIIDNNKDRIEEIINDNFPRYSLYKLPSYFEEKRNVDSLKEHGVQYNIKYAVSLFDDISGNGKYDDIIIIDDKLDPKIKTMLVMKYNLVQYNRTSDIVIIKMEFL